LTILLFYTDSVHCASQKDRPLIEFPSEPYRTHDDAKAEALGDTEIPGTPAHETRYHEPNGLKIKAGLA
jgi:hypothetical protein